MAKFNVCRTLLAVQLVFVAIGVSSVEAGLGKFTKSVSRSFARSLTKVPIIMLDTSQVVTQNVGGTISRITKPSNLATSIVDKTFSSVSNVLGTSSRIFGKDVKKPSPIVFLYNQTLKYPWTTKQYMDAAKRIIGLALINITQYSPEMNTKKPADLSATPNLKLVETKLKEIGASKEDIDDLVTLLGRNGKKDIDEHIREDVMLVMVHKDGKFINHGPIDEIRFIAQHPSGFYKMESMTDYKLKAKTIFSSCTIIHPPILDEY